MQHSSEDAIKAEIASADLSMAVDGSFVETRSSHAARELKKRLDQLLGVGKDGVRSPYALTITQSPSGARVYRVGFRPNTNPRDGHLDLQTLSPTDVPGLLSPLTAINPSSTAGLHQRAATRSHKPECLLPTHKIGYKPIPRTRSGSISTGRPSTSTWEAERVPLPDDTFSECQEPTSTGPHYVRLGNTDLQIYTRTGDSDIFSSAMGWSDVPRDGTPNEYSLEGHGDLVWSAGFSPDGKSVVSGSDDNTIRIWDACGSLPIGQPLRGHSNSVNSVSYSPLGDIIASGSQDRTIRLWDTNTSRQLGGALEGDHSFLSVAFSPDARLIVSGSAGYYASPTTCAVQLWDVQNRKAASRPFKGHTDLVCSVSFSPTGSRVLSSSYDKTIRIWDVEQGVTVVGPLKGNEDVVRSVAFSPDGAQIVSGSFDGTIRLWDSRNGARIGEPYEGHTSAVYSIAFSPCEEYVVSGGNDNTIRLWDIRTGRQVDRIFEEHTSTVSSVAFSPCGQYIASGSHDRKVIIRKVLSEDPNLNEDVEPQIITSQMSTLQLFDCLRRAGCVDLSSEMDSNQETAMIVSGGGFGDIWKGELYSGAKVAIKSWRTNALGECEYITLKRAARELYLWSRMNHRHIHRLQGVIVFKDHYLGMVSEWMENGNLHEYLRKCPDVDRYQLCIHVASGLKYMHSRGMVHGDLKAVNVLVSSDGIARLSDFDFSVMSQVSSLVFSESSNSRLGSIRWASPEILLEETRSRTTQSDVYALGMEIFTGDVPFPDRRTDIGVIRAVDKGTLPTRPTALGKDRKGNMMWSLMLSCWSRGASERPSSEHVVSALSNMCQSKMWRVVEIDNFGGFHLCQDSDC
ncbi:unnamed protein product [Rhizoctonia solani]|uniref:Protein kinase domain-containing protein n=1 Tax=Rhizoctonia solani TaxID=456999 RepID=A0A8H3DU62_9AGAM|nr:unnamed protein product [Rhizoctonia solani]